MPSEEVCCALDVPVTSNLAAVQSYVDAVLR